MSKLKLHTSAETQTELHELHEQCRKGTEHVKVPRKALIGLLMDHAALVGKVGEGNVEEPRE